MRRDVFQAIADPTRRAIVGLLASQALNLNGIAGHFSISRPAVSRHIRILSECGLVVVRDEGRERFCSANLQALRPVADWLLPYQQFWNQKLDDLGQLLGSGLPPVMPKKSRLK